MSHHCLHWSNLFAKHSYVQQKWASVGFCNRRYHETRYPNGTKLYQSSGELNEIVHFPCRIKPHTRIWLQKRTLSSLARKLEQSSGAKPVSGEPSWIFKFQTNKKAACMDSICELKLSIYSGIHRIIDRALYLEQAIEGLIGGPFAGCSPVDGSHHSQGRRGPLFLYSVPRGFLTERHGTEDSASL